jgi:hypothetical protein
VRTWKRRADIAAAQSDDATPGDDALVAESQRLDAVAPSALTVDEWTHLQRQVHRRLQKEIRNGSPSGTRWLSTTLGIVSDKLRAARLDPPTPGNDAEQLAATEARARRALQEYEKRQEHDPTSSPMLLRERLAERDEECRKLRVQLADLRRELERARREPAQRAIEAADDVAELVDAVPAAAVPVRNDAAPRPAEGVRYGSVQSRIGGIW